MAEGYESDIAVKELYNGWGSAQEQGVGIEMHEPDSSDLDTGYEQNRRANKVRGNRWVERDLITNDYANPSGGFTIQPRNLELLPLFMSHYQMVEVVGGLAAEGSYTGTFRFAPAMNKPIFVGSRWGTFNTSSVLGGVIGDGGADTTNAFFPKDLYSLKVEQGLGTIRDEAGPVTQLRYEHGFVDQITWEQPWDEDLKLGFSFMFQGTEAKASNFYSANANFGTNAESTEQRYTGWTGTLTFDGTSNNVIEVDNFGFVTQNKAAGKGRVGGAGFGNFRWADDEAVGRLHCEFQDYHVYEKVLSGSSFQVTMDWYSSATNWLRVQMYNCVMRPSTPDLSSGDAPIELDLEFECAATTVGGQGTPSHVVMLFGAYATSLISIDASEGAARAT